MRPSHGYRLLCLLLLASTLVAQDRDQQLFNRLARGKEQVKPDELVSFKSDYPYTKAIRELSELAKKFTGKIIVDTSPIKSDETKTIGANIQSMYWKDALEVILRANENWYDETPEYYLVYNLKEGRKDVSQLPQGGQTQGAVQGGGTQGAQQQLAPPVVDSSKIYAEMREITVSAILLDVNQSKLHENGISFSIFRGSNVNVGFQFTGAAAVTANPALATATIAPTDPRLTVDVNAAIKFFENEGYGEVVSRPVVRVRGGATTRIQIGSTLPFLQKDFAGNVTQQFIESGTILQVWPKIYKYNNADFIDLRYLIDKSTPSVSAGGGITVDHNKVDGSLFMLDGERTYVSGLITSTQTTQRQGVPLLKDLPWWVLGLRYIFGYDNVTMQKRELIMIIDAKLEPSIEQRTTTNMKNTQKTVDEKARQLREDTQKLMKKDN